MSDSIGRITVPSPISSGLTFPLISEMGYGYSQSRPIITHRFGELDTKAEQRYQVGIGPGKYFFKRSTLSYTDKANLASFWESVQGSFKTFLYNAPTSSLATTLKTVQWEDTPIDFEYLVNACRVGFSFIEYIDPSSAPSYSITSTVTRFPSTSLTTALLDQVQKIIPLVKIRVRESAVADVFLSDRRVTVGGQLYLPRILGIGQQGSNVLISQDIKGSADNVQFTFGDADNVFTEFLNDTDIKYATLEFSLFHVNTGILLQLWSGSIQRGSVDYSGKVLIQASDGLYQTNERYPVRTVGRQCWKTFNDGTNCPWAIVSGVGDGASCDYYFDSANGCVSHDMARYFGAHPAQPQGIRIKDNSTGVAGFGRNVVTATSIISDTIWGQTLADVWCNGGGDPTKAFFQNALVADVRDEGDFFAGLGIVGSGPIGAFTPSQIATNVNGLQYIVSAMLDGFTPYGFVVNGNLTVKISNQNGLREETGIDPQPHGFHLSDGSSDTSSTPRAAGTAFVELRYKKPSGINPTTPDSHSMIVPLDKGLSGWTWNAAGTVRTLVPGLTNVFWVAINTYLKALGLFNATSSVQLSTFVLSSLIVGDGSGCAEIADAIVAKILGTGTETQFQFQGTISQRKPFRDWLTEILNCALGFYTFEFGKLRLGCRINASSVDAYTLGNIKYKTLKLSPIEATFEKLTIDFADQAYQYQANTAEYSDKDHAAYYGRSGSPIDSNLHSVGGPTLSQNLRIAATRTREEIGGINSSEWRIARDASFETTLLALGNYVGQVISITDVLKIPGLRGVCNVSSGGVVSFVSGDAFDASMIHKEILINGVQYTVLTVTSTLTCTPTPPTASGATFRVVTADFRIQYWELRSDYSILMRMKFVTPSMYNLDVGPKPSDVIPKALPSVVFPLPENAVWGPYQIQYSSTDPVFPNEWTFDLDIEYVMSKASTPILSAALTGKQPVNGFSNFTDPYFPRIGNVSISTTGGSLGDSTLNTYVYIGVCVLDANGIPCRPSQIAVAYLPHGTTTYKVTISNIYWPAFVGLTSYVVFAGTQQDLITAQNLTGLVSGTLTPDISGVVYTPNSIDITFLERNTFALPNPYTKYLRPKAKLIRHSGVAADPVTAIGSGFIQVQQFIDTSIVPPTHFDPTGRIVSCIGRSSTGSTPLYNGTVTSWDRTTGQLNLTPDPSGILQLGDVVVIRMKPVFLFVGGVTYSFNDTGLMNETNLYHGLTDNAEKGKLLRVIGGAGRGQITKITLNQVGTTVHFNPPLQGVDSTSIVIIEDPTWMFLGDATNIMNSEFSTSTKLNLPIDNFEGSTILVSAFTVNSIGVESADGDQPVREEYVYGVFASPSSNPYTPITPVGGIATVDFSLGGTNFEILLTADIVLANPINIPGGIGCDWKLWLKQDVFGGHKVTSAGSNFYGIDPTGWDTTANLATKHDFSYKTPTTIIQGQSSSRLII